MEDIIAALEDIQTQGSFCGKRMTSIDDLHLEVKEYGELKFPLNPRNAKALIKLAKPAKFGFRDKTLLDKSVRNAWEIPKSKIKTDKINWNKKLTRVIDLLKNDLGLPETAKLKASLHNLLIYEPGQFFEYHQDSEKLDGMVATLIIVLPSSHKGGTLVIDNQGVKKQFQSSRFPADKLTYIAFYADCHHAIQEVKEGYRFALTYNLILENDIKTKDQESYEPLALVKSLRSYFFDEGNRNENSHLPNAPKRCVYLLDHSYSQSGLSWNHLKNVDALRAEALKSAADILDLEIYMALADVQETWDCEMAYDNYGYHGSYYDDENEDEDSEAEEDQGSDDMQVNELIDSNAVLQYWMDRENKPLPYKECHISSRYIGWTKACNKFKPFQSEYEGFMGNYGNTMDRWYHRAAIILWKKTDHYPVLFDMDPTSVFSEVLKLIKKKSQEASVSNIINSLLPYWSQHLRQQSGTEICLNIFKLALYVKDSKLAQAMLMDFDIAVLNPALTESLLSLQDAYGTSLCIKVLQEWAKPKDRWNTSSKISNISDIVKILNNYQKHQELTEWLLTHQLNIIKKDSVFYVKDASRARLIESLSGRIEEITDFTKACVIVSNNSVYLELLSHIIDHVKLYPSIELMSIIFFFRKKLKANDLKKWNYQKLFNYVYNELKNEQKVGLRKVDDWSINEKLSCSCDDCGTLKQFLESRTSKIIRWPLGKDRRKHIHQAIDQLSIPVLHKTEHTGSPHKLIITKTDNLYKGAKQRFDNLEKALSRLNSLAAELAKIFHTS